MPPNFELKKKNLTENIEPADDGVSIWVIIGPILLVFLAILAICIYLWYKRKFTGIYIVNP